MAEIGWAQVEYKNNTAKMADTFPGQITSKFKKKKFKFEGRKIIFLKKKKYLL